LKQSEGKEQSLAKNYNQDESRQAGLQSGIVEEEEGLY